MLLPVLAVFDFSVHNLIVAFVVLLVVVILFVALWQLVAPMLGRYANAVLAVFVVIIILIIASIFGVFT
jgi:hypothetical protein